MNEIEVERERSEDSIGTVEELEEALVRAPDEARILEELAAALVMTTPSQNRILELRRVPGGSLVCAPRAAGFGRA